MSLALINYHATGSCGGIEIYLHTFLILVLEDSMLLISRPASLYPAGENYMGGHHSRPGHFGGESSDFAVNRRTVAWTSIS